MRWLDVVFLEFLRSRAALPPVVEGIEHVEVGSLGFTPRGTLASASEPNSACARLNTHCRATVLAGAFFLGLGAVCAGLEAQDAGTALRVLGVSPSAQVLTAPTTGVIEVQFSEAVDAASVSEASFVVFGRWSSVVDGTRSVDDSVVRFVPDRALSAGDWITVRLTPSIQSQTGSPLSGGYSWNFWSRAEPAGLNFQKLAELEPGEVPYGAHGGDLDHDGDVDLAVPSEADDNVAVFLNNGGGAFGPATFYATGRVPSPIEAIDLNGDRNVDLVISNTLSDDISLYLGRGDGTFEQQARYEAGIGPRGLAPIDINRDGRLDLVVANRESNDLSFFGNLGDGRLSDTVRFDSPGFAETQVHASDINGDGLEDMVVAYLTDGQIRVFLADRDGTFTIGDQADAGGEVWQMALGDLNGDGLLDVVTANHQTDRAGVLLATAPGVFANAVTYSTGTRPIAIDVGDLDGDGDLDVVTSNFISGTFTLLRNAGDGTFTRHQDIPANSSGSCAVLHDLDGDGDLDLTGIDEVDNSVLLFRNN